MLLKLVLACNFEKPLHSHPSIQMTLEITSGITEPTPRLNILIINIAVTSNFFSRINLFYRFLGGKIHYFWNLSSGVFRENDIFRHFSPISRTLFYYSGLEIFFIYFYLSVVGETHTICCKIFLFQIAQNRFFTPFSCILRSSTSEGWKQIKKCSNHYNL